MAGHREFEAVLKKQANLYNSDHQTLYGDVQKEALDIEKEILKMIEITKACGSRTIEIFNIASPGDPTVQRRLSFELALPRPAAACGPIGSRDHRGIPVAPASAYGAVGFSSGGLMEPLLAPKAPPARFNNGRSWIHDSRVRTLNDIASPSQVGQCHCCTTCSSRSGTQQMLIQEQQLNMADSIRKPKHNRSNHDDDPSEGGSGDDSHQKDRKDKTKKKYLDDVDGDDGNGFGPNDSDGDSEGSSKARRNQNDDNWKFDSRLLKPPKVYDGTGLAYFQPWLEMLKSEMMSKWEPWGDILKVLEEAGERRLDPNPIEISDILHKSKTRRTTNQIKIKLFRILKGMTSGEAQSAIVQGMTPGVFDVFRRLISKGKSRTKAAVRELRHKLNMPRRAQNIGDYDNAVAEWGSAIAKLVSYRGQDTVFAEEDLFEAYNLILPPEVMTFAGLKIDEALELDGFREEMEKHIYRRLRESKANKAPLANVMKDFQEQARRRRRTSAAPYQFAERAKGRKEKARATGRKVARGYASIAESRPILRQIVTSPRQTIMTKVQGTGLARIAKASTKLLTHSRQLAWNCFPRRQSRVQHSIW